ncbi:hypothetical protein [Opitutus sp. GAS368]|jgi:hypothetical protein|uniref:hypothetical protein n=1 Tax=Opitutus sp. GAS368 TaxID=1882749 RepID=UPI000879A50C|nr:hypothetical protein [Opitutus sp. GAS368]SDR66941.1 hypothetical protein SAMN05444173_0251 [Opitutus sp. GAS368]
MNIRYHPDFPSDINRQTAVYGGISPRLGQRFREEVDQAMAAIIAEPAGAGHFVNTGSKIVREVRRRNLSSFPFFILYGLAPDWLVFGSLIPSTSDPVKWLERFPA